jgi:hypothetical protein
LLRREKKSARRNTEKKDRRRAVVDGSLDSQSQEYLWRCDWEGQCV